MENKTIPCFFLTYNRLEYSKKALEALLNTEYPIEIYWHDNGSTDGTQEWMSKVQNTTNRNIIFSQGKVNEGINKPFNRFLKKYKQYEFVAKVDNDTIVQPDWLDQLIIVMRQKPELDAIGAYMQRPPGDAGSFEQWTNSNFMRKTIFTVPDPLYRSIYESLSDTVKSKENVLAYCAYCGGTGVLIRMRMFREMGLLWEGYKSMQGDLTCMFRLRSDNGSKNNIAWYSGTVVKLLNIKVDGKELSNDYPEYDAELNYYRDAGNKWYVENGGPKGIARLIEESGGREKL